jgi:hypothetical protein
MVTITEKGMNQFDTLLNSTSNKFNLSINDNGQFVEDGVELPIFMDSTIIRGSSLGEIDIDSFVDRCIDQLTKSEAEKWVLNLFKDAQQVGPLKYIHIRITPFIAKIFQKAETFGNRKATPAGLKPIIAALENGTFHEDTGNTIKLGKRGDMNDGNHRMTAIIITGIAANLTLCQGVSHSGALGHDTGRKRDFETFYEMYKRQKVSHIEPSVKTEALILRYEYYLRTHGPKFLRSTRLFVNPAIEKMIWPIHNEDVKLIETAAAYGNAMDKKLCAKSIMGLLAYRILKTYPTIGKTYLDLIRDGNDLTKNHVILRIRDRLSDIKNQKLIAKRDDNGKRIPGEKIHYSQEAKNKHIIPIVCKGFKYYKAGKIQQSYVLEARGAETAYSLITSI